SMTNIDIIGQLDIVSYLHFFFQAEDGIRDRTVTGVQTCALPISAAAAAHKPADRSKSPECAGFRSGLPAKRRGWSFPAGVRVPSPRRRPQFLPADCEFRGPAPPQVPRWWRNARLAPFRIGAGARSLHDSPRAAESFH